MGELADLARVSIRTLHHYDAIGLLAPSGRTGSGYRLYGHDELEQLQQILLYRELDFSLDAIARIMLDPTFDRRAALVAQREQLAARAGRMEAILAAIDAALEALARGEPMNDADMFEVFGDFDPAQYEIEVKERWGDTDAYRESARRTSRYTKDDWKRIKAEGDDVAGGSRIGWPQVATPGTRTSRPWSIGIATRSTSGSTLARSRCRSTWATCTWRTRGSLRRTIVTGPGWPGSSGTRSGSVPGAPPRPTETRSGGIHPDNKERPSPHGSGAHRRVWLGAGTGRCPAARISGSGSGTS